MAQPAKRIQWTVEWAAAEFGINPRTLVGRIKRMGLEPVGTSGGKNDSALYSTKQITQAVFGDYEGERIRKIKEEADQIAMENEVARGNLIEAEVVRSRWVGIMTKVRMAIESAEVPESLKAEIFGLLEANR